MTLATVTDVRAKLKRDLTAPELLLADASLAAAEAAWVAVHGAGIIEEAHADPNLAHVIVTAEADTAAHLVSLADSYVRAQINGWPFTSGG